MSAGETLCLRLDPCAGAQDASLALAAALEEPRARRGKDLAGAAYLRIEQPLGKDADLVAWLRAHPALPRAYWGSRGGLFALAGVGIADEVEGPDFSILEPMLAAVATGEAADKARLIATARFDLSRPPERIWSAFGRVRVYLPLLELRRSAAQCELAVNLKVGPGLQDGWFDAQRRSAQKTLLDGAAWTGPSMPAPEIDWEQDHDAPTWREHVHRVLGEIAGARLEKAVLARRVTLTGAVDPLDLFERRMKDTPEAFHLFVQPNPGVAFLAASPERLYRRHGRRLETESLAGTRTRGASAEEDARIAKELLACEKELLEHQFVRSHIVDRLAPLCDGVGLPPGPVVHVASQLQHLRTPLTARLKEGVNDATLLDALHPTPAVCGLPTHVALEFIRKTEGFDRGLYAGPIGCVGRTDTEFAVGIRSALVRSDAVQLFAGAGIVNGSDAEAEWQETVDKMMGLLQLLEADEPA